MWGRIRLRQAIAASTNRRESRGSPLLCSVETADVEAERLGGLEVDD